MSRPSLFILLVALITVCSGCTSKKTEAERTILTELKKLESYTQTGLSYSQYSDRLLTTLAEVDVVRDSVLTPDDDFFARRRVVDVESSFKRARDAWKQNLDDGQQGDDRVQRAWGEASDQLRQFETYVSASSSKRSEMDSEYMKKDKSKPQDQ